MLSTSSVRVYLHQSIAVPQPGNNCSTSYCGLEDFGFISNMSSVCQLFTWSGMSTK